MYADSDLIPLSALQHYTVCPRQCALIHLENVWADNRLTAEGRLLHERADTDTRERRGDTLIVRGLYIRSLRLGLTGRADVVEFTGTPPVPRPVEYKHGRPKAGLEDKIQLCAQGMCLEEMLGVEVSFGSIYYAKPNRRLDVILDFGLRNETERIARAVHTLFDSNLTPSAISVPACAGCSLVDLCLPDQVGRRVKKYLKSILEEP